MRTLASSRAAAVGGVLFAVLYVASLFGVLDIPDGSDSDAAVRAAFVDDRAQIVVGVYLLALAGLGFLWFLGGLHARLREQATGRTLTAVVLAGGLVYVVMLYAAAATWGVLAFATAFDEIPEPVNADVARTLTQLGFVMLLIFGLLGAAAMIVAASAAILRDRLPARWLGWAGLPIAALLLLGPFYAPQLLVPLWVAVASIALLWRAPSSREPG